MAGETLNDRLVGSVRWVYVITAWLVPAAVVVQFLLAGMGVFAAADVGGFSLHRSFGGIVALLMVLLFIMSLIVGPPMRRVGMAAGLIGLFALQVLLVVPSYAGGSIRAVSALHVVNGLVIFWLALVIARRARSAVAPKPEPRQDHAGLTSPQTRRAR